MEPDCSLPLRDIARDALRRVVAAMPAGAARDGQADMCAETADVIDAAEQGRLAHLTVAAGTGTGKSLAYLTAAAVSGRQTVVATATKALQDQLLHHDVPALAEGLGRPVTAATLKGRGSYLCRQKADERAGEQAQGVLTAASADAAQETARLLEWAKTTPSGDEADLPFEPSREVWADLTSDSAECPGAAKCPAGHACFAEKAKQRAAKADVVIVNQHLYLLSSRIGMENLPPHSFVVIDEAHELESVASSVFGTSVSPRRFRRLRDNASGHINDSTAANLKHAADTLFETLHEHVDRPFGEHLPPDVSGAAMGASIALMAVENELSQSLNELTGAHLPGIDTEPENGDHDEQRLRRACGEADALNADISFSMNAGAGWASWAEQIGRTRSVAWRTAPADVAGLLHAAIWEHTSAVLTSATVPPSHERSVGVDLAGAHRAIDVGSPFAYRSSLLYVPRRMPRPGSPGWAEALHAEAADLIEAAGGRTLMLCTSWKTVDDAAEHLRVRLPTTPILTQRDHPKPELLRRFSADPAACLIGTLGLWQGVDVPGESLSLVIVARLPFPRPDDPVIAARRALAGDDAFSLVDLPLAATRLAQGAGRLIRNETDRGVVAVLDPRLATAGYRAAILNTMPPFKRTIDKPEVVAALNRIRDRSIPAQAAA